MNATPHQMSQAEKEVENFIRNIHGSKKERKPVRPHVVEVTLLTELINIEHCSHEV